MRGEASEQMQLAGRVGHVSTGTRVLLAHAEQVWPLRPSALDEK